MRVLDALSWIALLLAGFAVHEWVGLPDWLMPLFALPAFVYAGWRTFASRRQSAALVMGLVVAGVFFRELEWLPAAQQDLWLTVAGIVIPLGVGLLAGATKCRA